MASKKLQDRMGPEMRCRLHFKKWTQMVRRENLAFKIPDELIDSLPEELDSYVMPVLEQLGVVKNREGFWERR